MRNAGQSDPVTAQSTGKGVHLVHTPLLGPRAPLLTAQPKYRAIGLGRLASTYRRTMCFSITMAQRCKSMLPAAAPTTSSKASSLVKLCR